jgi:hypothetical protein
MKLFSALSIGVALLVACGSTESPRPDFVAPPLDAAVDGSTSDHPVLPVYLEVLWTIDSSTDTTRCVTYGIKRWRVEASGPATYTHEIDCTEIPWTSGDKLHGVKPGIYTINVHAVDASDKLLATASQSNFNVSGTLVRLTLEFSPTVFQTPDGG